MNESSSLSPVAIAFIGGGNRAMKYLKYVTDHEDHVSAAAIVEPNAFRRDRFAEIGQIPAEGKFGSADEFFSEPRDVNAVVICTPDVTHYDYAMRALRHGYHVLLEKPIAPTIKQCNEIAELAREKGLIVSVCHILRYHPYFKKIKEIIDSGELGRVVSVSHSEAVGIDRSCHSYVRGLWRRDDIATPMVLTKFCHDTDLVAWWTSSPMKSIRSFGSLRWFKESNAPEGAAARCIDCKSETEETCPYSAVELYKRRQEWIANFDKSKDETMDEVIDRELTTGLFGRCVFHCDNNVVDRQIIAMEMENGVTVNMSMNLFTLDDNRTTHICLTHGEIFGDEREVRTVRFRDRKRKIYDFSDIRNTKYHGGADFLIVEDFVKAIDGSAPGYLPVAHIDDIIESHRICFDAEIRATKTKR